MTFAMGTATDTDDFISQLNTFLTVTDGNWTEDDLDTAANEAAWHLTSPDSVYVQARWESNVIALFQSLDYDGSAPGSNPDDSGNGDGVGAITAERRISGIGAGPYTQHFFLSGDEHVHVVLEYSGGLYRHFSFGNIVKQGSWTGGAYCVAHHWDQGAIQIDDHLHPNHTFLWDAAMTLGNGEGGTIHLEDFDGQPANGKWGVIWGSDGDPGDDTAGEDRETILGGLRDGPLSIFGGFPASSINGYIPLIPIPLFHRNLTPNPDEWRLLGFVPDARLINIANLNPEQEITVDGDTWVVFPWVRKQESNNNTEESGNAGIAYKKNV